MAISNGHAGDDLFPSDESVVFTVGKREIRVAALTLRSLQLCKDELLAIGPGDWVEQADLILQVVSKLGTPRFEKETLISACLAGEALSLPTSMQALLQISGFERGEAVAVTDSPGTGTSSPLPPNSPAEESVVETSTG